MCSLEVAGSEPGMVATTLCAEKLRIVLCRIICSVPAIGTGVKSVAVALARRSATGQPRRNAAASVIAPVKSREDEAGSRLSWIDSAAERGREVFESSSVPTAPRRVASSRLAVVPPWPLIITTILPFGSTLP